MEISLKLVTEHSFVSAPMHFAGHVLTAEYIGQAALGSYSVSLPVFPHFFGISAKAPFPGM